MLPKRSISCLILPITRFLTSASVSACSGGSADFNTRKAEVGRGFVGVGECIVRVSAARRICSCACERSGETKEEESCIGVGPKESQLSTLATSPIESQSVEYLEVG